MEVGCVLINVGLIVVGSVIFFMCLGMISYGARLEQKYQQLLQEYKQLLAGYKELLEEKEKHK